MNAKTEKADLLETLKAAYGDHPEDVLGVLRIAVETLAQLEAIFSSIQGDLERTRSPLVDTKNLAGAGRYLASDFGNYIDCEHGRLRDNLRRSGIDCRGAV